VRYRCRGQGNWIDFQSFWLNKHRSVCPWVCVEQNGTTPKDTLRSAVGDNMIRGSAKMVLEIIREARSLIAVLSATAKALRLPF